jgi:hypothetical protein
LPVHGQVPGGVWYGLVSHVWLPNRDQKSYILHQQQDQVYAVGFGDEGLTVLPHSIADTSVLCMAAKQGPNVLFCMPSRTKCIKLVSLMQGCAAPASSMVENLSVRPLQETAVEATPLTRRQLPPRSARTTKKMVDRVSESESEQSGSASDGDGGGGRRANLSTLPRATCARRLDGPPQQVGRLFAACPPPVLALTLNPRPWTLDP